MKLTVEQRSEIISEKASSEAGFNELMRVFLDSFSKQERTLFLDEHKGEQGNGFRPATVDDSEGRRTNLTPEPQTELTTWLFDERTFVPSAKIVGERRHSIITDYLGTPVEAYDEVGKRVWKRELDIYERVRMSKAKWGWCPSCTKGSTSTRRRGSPTTASATTRPRQEPTSVKTPFVSRRD